MPCLRSNFSQRFEDETALVHGGMWNGQPLGFNDRIPKQKNIDIDVARTFFLSSPSSHLLFNVQNSAEQLPRHFFGIQFDRAIQEPGLGGKFDRFSFVKR